MSKKSNFENNFEQIFNLPDSPPLVKDVEVLKPDTKNDDIESDYKYARENLYNAIERGSASN